MLTGMVAPTDGYAFVGGRNIRSEMPKIRQEIGLCLQHVSNNRFCLGVFFLAITYTIGK